jgi:tRNA 2-selenouridine synthase
MAMIHEIAIEVFFRNPTALIDVRSPGEYRKGHVPGAVNIPLFSDEERTEVGTVYVKQSKEKAIELAYSYVNPKLDHFIVESKKAAPGKKVAVHCWRGGMRSQMFARHLHENGFPEVFVIAGGYKSYRNFVLKGFDNQSELRIVGGYTGSGKSYIIGHLRDKGQQVIDLEDMASHKGSAFGHIGKQDQPTSEQFENDLFKVWISLDHHKPIWLEDESRNIGGVNIPVNLYRQMLESPVFFLDIPREERAKHLVSEYAGAASGQLAESIGRLTRRLGGLNTSLALNYLKEQKFYEAAMTTLLYYDKSYLKGLSYRNREKIFTIMANDVNTTENATTLLKYNSQYERDQTDTI